MRKAKIVCTLGPATDAPGVLEGMIRAGMDVARLNFSHGTPEEHQRRFRRIRAASRAADRPVAVLQDVQGPKIRLGAFAGGQLAVQTGETVTVTTRKVIGSGTTLPTPIASLTRDVTPGDPVLLDDGRVRLQVIRVRGPDVLCLVTRGGLLKDHKGLNLPASHVSVPTLTKKDIEDLAFGQELGVDYVALSFVRSAADVRQARAHVSRRGTPLIAKIEKPQAVAALNEIASVADGIMVARGDLGVEMPLEALPGIQKAAVATGNRCGGIVIVATEMLESMITNARPTRAEVSDVANAVADGADAVMLSGETAVGRYPVEAVATMARIIEEAECSIPMRTNRPYESSQDISTGVAAAAVAAAAQLQIDMLVTYTWSGYTARLISELRPRARILALTPNPEIVHRMALCWGVSSRLVRQLSTTDAMVAQVRRLCRQDGLCKPGAPVVIVAGVPLNLAGNTNLMTVHRI
jgi:pyruvate kinase